MKSLFGLNLYLRPQCLTVLIRIPKLQIKFTLSIIIILTPWSWWVVKGFFGGCPAFSIIVILTPCSWWTVRDFVGGFSGVCVGRSIEHYSVGVIRVRIIELPRITELHEAYYHDNYGHAIHCGVDCSTTGKQMIGNWFWVPVFMLTRITCYACGIMRAYCLYKLVKFHNRLVTKWHFF